MSDPETPAEMRAHMVERLFRPKAIEWLRAHPEHASVVLCVAQYWNDEANDAVHAFVYASAERDPPWPLGCDDDARWGEAPVACEGKRCENCDEGLYITWYDNGMAIPAFEAYCREGCHQEMDEDEAYLPYAVARRDGDGVDIEIVGRVVRPWIDRAAVLAEIVPPDDEEAELLECVYARPDDDAPRLVLADWLLERGDPRGELIALQLRPELGPAQAARAARLQRTLGMRLLGPIAPVVSVASAALERGFPSSVEVRFESEQDVSVYGHLSAWATVRHLRFHEDGLDRVTTAMHGLRVLEGVEADALAGLQAADWPWAIERLDVLAESAAALEILSQIETLPALRRLTLRGVRATDGALLLRRAPWAGQLETLRVPHSPCVDAGAWARVVARTSAHTLRLDGEHEGWTAGRFDATLTRGAGDVFDAVSLRLGSAGYGENRLVNVQRLLRSLGETGLRHVTLEGDRQPLDADLNLLRAAAGPAVTWTLPLDDL